MAALPRTLPFMATPKRFVARALRAVADRLDPQPEATGTTIVHIGSLDGAAIAAAILAEYPRGGARG